MADERRPGARVLTDTEETETERRNGTTTGEPRLERAAGRKRAPRAYAALKWLIPAALAVVLIAWTRSRPAPVEVAPPVARTVVESIAASGQVRGDVESDVGAPVGGRVAAVFVREGDRVRSGQPLARLDDRVLRQQMESAAAAVRTAAAQREQAARPPLFSDVARLRADTTQAVKVAQARLAGARQQLAELEAGARPEEIEQAEAQFRQAQAQQAEARARQAQARAQREQARAQQEQAARDSDRVERLQAEGALSQADLDRARTAREVAARAVEAAQGLYEAAVQTLEAARRAAETADARLRQLRAGPRREQVEAARADVEAARATLAGAERSGAAQLRSLLATPRPEDVRVAEAQVREARLALDVTRQRAQETVVNAPFDGTVTRVLVEVGGLTGPGQPLLKLVRTPRPEIRVQVDENNLGRLRVGQPAVVSSEAYEGETFQARVREVGAEVDFQRGTVEVRLDPLAPPAWLRPGQTVSVNIIVDPGRRRLVVPLPAVRTVGDRSTVLVVEGGRTAERAIQVGPAGPDGIPVLSGLTERDRVVANPSGMQAGTKIAPRAAGSGRER